MSNKASESAMKVLLMAGLAAGAITVACTGKATQDPQAAAIPAMPVKVIEASALPISDATEYVATLKSRDSATGPLIFQSCSAVFKQTTHFRVS